MLTINAAPAIEAADLLIEITSRYITFNIVRETPAGMFKAGNPKCGAPYRGAEIVKLVAWPGLPPYELTTCSKGLAIRAFSLLTRRLVTGTPFLYRPFQPSWSVRSRDHCIERMSCRSRRHLKENRREWRGAAASDMFE
jgi:hypothetical protein